MAICLCRSHQQILTTVPSLSVSLFNLLFSFALRVEEMNEGYGVSRDNQTSIDLDKQKLDKLVETLDSNLDRVLKKQEHDYLKGYSIYVK